MISKCAETVANIVSRIGVRVDPGKVEAMLNIGRPVNVQELKSFLGATSYYRRFIRDYATLCAPLRRIENIFTNKLQPLPLTHIH